MHKNDRNVASARSGKWLLKSVTLGLAVAGVAAWFRQRQAKENFGEVHEGYPDSTRSSHGVVTTVKDKVTKVAQKVRDAHPSAKQQIVEVEEELHPGG